MTRGSAGLRRVGPRWAGHWLAGLAGLAGLVAVGLALAGCGGPGASSPAGRPATGTGANPAGRDGSPAGAPAPAAASAADVAALAAARAWLSYDTTVDRRPNDTARRLAVPLLTPSLRRQVTGFAGPADAGAEWAEWTRHRARATVSAALAGDDHPPDTPGTAYRQVTATITLRGDGGWTAVQRRTLFLQLARPSGKAGWLVADLRSTDGA